MRLVLRSALVILVTLAAALGLGAGTAQAQEGPQVWGFIDTPTAVDAGWQGPLVVAWRNASETTRSYDVALTGTDLADGSSYSWTTTLTLAPAESVREELVPPALAVAGTYRAQLSRSGSDVVQPVEIVVGGGAAGAAPVQVLDIHRSAAAVAPRSSDRSRRSVATTFRLSREAGVTASVVDAAGRTVVRRSLGDRAAGATQSWAWTGRDAAGRTVTAGRYTVRVTASAGGRTATSTVAVRVQR